MSLFRAVVRKWYSNGASISKPYVVAKDITEALKKIEKDIHSTLSDPSNRVLSIREVEGYLLK